MKYKDKDLDVLFDNIYEYMSKLDAKIMVIKEGLTCIVDLLKKEDAVKEPKWVNDKIRKGFNIKVIKPGITRLTAKHEDK